VAGRIAASDSLQARRLGIRPNWMHRVWWEYR
jgi:hypothetical protein